MLLTVLRSLAQHKNTALHLACFYGHKDIVELLIEKGSGINEGNMVRCLHLSEVSSTVSTREMCKHSGTAILTSPPSPQKKKKLVKCYISKTVKCKTGLSTPSLPAMLISVCLRKAKCPDIGRFEVSFPPLQNGQTPLQLAAVKGHLDIVKILTSLGVELDTKTDVSSPHKIYQDPDPVKTSACYQTHRHCRLCYQTN